MKDTCKHRATWIMAAGRLEWCYHCGAVRILERNEKSNTCFPVSPWQCPTGPNGENPEGEFADRTAKYKRRQEFTKL